MSKISVSSTITPVATIVGSSITAGDCVADNGKQYFAVTNLDSTLALSEPAASKIVAIDPAKTYEVIAGETTFSAAQ